VAAGGRREVAPGRWRGGGGQANRSCQPLDAGRHPGAGPRDGRLGETGARWTVPAGAVASTGREHQHAPFDWGSLLAKAPAPASSPAMGQERARMALNGSKGVGQLLSFRPGDLSRLNTERFRAVWCCLSVEIHRFSLSGLGRSIGRLQWSQCCRIEEMRVPAVHTGDEDERHAGATQGDTVRVVGKGQREVAGRDHPTIPTTQRTRRLAAESLLERRQDALVLLWCEGHCSSLSSAFSGIRRGLPGRRSRPLHSSTSSRRDSQTSAGLLVRNTVPHRRHIAGHVRLTTVPPAVASVAGRASSPA
jgi:hypothetical protein